MPRFSLRSFLLVTALLAAGIGLVARPYWQATTYVRHRPISTLIVERPDGTIVATSMAYSMGDYGIMEFGNTRLAIRGYTFPVASRLHVLVLKTDSLNGSSWYSCTTAGKSSISLTGIPGGTACKFNDISFSVISGRLQIDGKTFDALNQAQAVIVDESGKFIEVHDLPGASPALGSSAEGGTKR